MSREDAPDPPPRWAERLLARCVEPGVVGASIVGDLREEHARRSADGRGKADRWYVREAGGIALRSLAGTGRGRGDSMATTILSDLRLAVRSLAKAPRFTVVAVFTLALGIGANTAIFSVVSGVLLEPLEYEDSDRLVNVWSTAPGLGYDQFPVSPDIYFAYAAESAAIPQMALHQPFSGSVTEDGEPERVTGAIASHTLFPTLGVTPVLGRVYTADEDLPDMPPVVVLSHALWQRRFGGDRGVLGRTLQLDGRAREIIGVMPAGFDFPRSAEFWLPLGLDPANANQGTFAYNAIGRLAPGATPATAQEGLESILASFGAALTERDDGSAMYAAFLDNGRYAPVVHAMKEDLVGDLEQPLWILLGTVGFVLLIACANVANLVLIRSEVRRRETAVRVAIGATRSTIARNALVESAVIAVAGAGLGVLVAWVGVPLVLTQAPPEIPRLDEVGVDGTALLFTGLITALATALFGLPPALRFSRPDVLGSLKQGGRGTTERARGTARRLLVVGQTSLALVLLVGSGLLVRSFQRVLSSDMGFDSDGRLTFGVFLPEARYGTSTDVVGFQERLRERLAAIPGVRSVGFASVLPLDGAPGTAHVIEGQEAEPGQLPPMLHYAYVGPGYMEAMGLRLREGRALDARDLTDATGTAVVSATVADQFWPDGALGARLRQSSDSAWYEVVGVVAPVVQENVRDEPRPMVYYPMLAPDGHLTEMRGGSYVVEAATPLALTDAARRAVWELDPDLPVADLRTMDEIVADSVVELSFTMFTLAMAALLALILGAVGLYGVLSYSVAQRTQEIGVRMALGAQAGEVLGMIVREGAATQAVGLVLGLAGAAALTRVLQGLLFGVEALDPVTFLATSALLLAVGLLAAYLPARRAARLDPVTSMRAE